MKKNCSSVLDCAEEKTDLFTKKGYLIKECTTCGHRFTDIKDIEKHLSESFSDDYFFEGKEGYPNYLEERDMLYKSGVKFTKVIAKYMKPGRVLDVGCAAGFILKAFKDAGWEAYGVEPNDTMASYGRNELGLDIRTGGMETFNSDQKFDLINLIEVIGSLYDLDKAMQNVRDLCKQGGLVLVESWDMKCLAAKFFGPNWHEYCPPSVVHWYSDNTLKQLFNYYGFELIAKGRPSKRINLKHGLAIIAENSSKSKLKKKFFSFLSRTLGNVPVPYPPVDVKWYLFKKS
ncbi:MAG: class I SAM-dependent methyltransferase [Bacteroidetes bacterium]|nr:class I SAM-dependent methyltransferase [Bacteroidota bacterium]